MTVRSMALQIKEEPTSRRQGARGEKSGSSSSTWCPSYSLQFASMALSVPGRCLRVLGQPFGIGRCDVVTWGQILHERYAGCGNLRDMGGRILTTGLSCIMGMTFAFLASRRIDTPPETKNKVMHEQPVKSRNFKCTILRPKAPCCAIDDSASSSGPARSWARRRVRLGKTSLGTSICGCDAAGALRSRVKFCR
jgi:hypothetical protein